VAVVSVLLVVVKHPTIPLLSAKVQLPVARFLALALAVDQLVLLRILQALTLPLLPLQLLATRFQAGQAATQPVAFIVMSP